MTLTIFEKYSYVDSKLQAYWRDYCDYFDPTGKLENLYMKSDNPYIGVNRAKNIEELNPDSNDILLINLLYKFIKERE